MDRRIYLTDHTLGIIKIVPSESEFPWEMFIGGEINCAYGVRYKTDTFNDIRIWLDENASKTVFIHFSKWSFCKFAFTSPQDAIKFLIKFGDVIKKLDG